MPQSRLHIITLLLLGSLSGQTVSPQEDLMREATRTAQLQHATEKILDKKPPELIEIASNSATPDRARIAAALLLLKGGLSPEVIEAALTTYNLKMAAGIDEWESAGSWTLAFPVASELGLRENLIPLIIDSTIDGRLSEIPTVFVLLRFRKVHGTLPGYLEEARKKTLTHEQRQRLERLDASLTGKATVETPATPKVQSFSKSSIAQNAAKYTNTSEWGRRPDDHPSPLAL
jgi:hypothetical protein